ncbi:hypothetical protein TNCV_2185051 [Trichonephila clavipes]|nr:hypothetical protein TNCV_2185051 [Trichonephila clavipes]
MWMMTKLLISVATIVGFNRCHTNHHKIKQALDVTLGNSSPCGVHIIPICGVAVGGVSRSSRCAIMDHTFLVSDRSEEQAGKGSNSIQSDLNF